MNVKGFTLLEMLISLAVFSILLSMAVPSFKETIKNNQLRSVTNNTYTLMQYARAEAVRTGSTIHFGAFDNNDWAVGAVVWIDNGDHTFTVPAKNDDNPDKELRRTEQKNTLSVIENSGLATIWFNGKGYVETGRSITPPNFTLNFCDSRPEETGRLIKMLRSGFSAVSMKDDC